MTILFVVACVLAIGGVLYGVLTNRKRIDVLDSLELPDLRAFDKAWCPVTLVLADEFGSQEERVMAAARFAVEVWNRQTGVRLFAMPGDVGEGTVVPIMEAPADSTEHSHAVAFTRYTIGNNGALKSAAIYLKPDWQLQTKAVLERAIAHELGHCLGLTHDDLEESVMYASANPSRYYVTEKDSVFLRSIYG